MKKLGQSGNKAQLWMCLMLKVNPNAVRTILHRKFEILGPWSNIWNIRSDQGKLDVVKQEMATMNNDILGFGELKWTRMLGEFNLDDHYIYCCGQESLRRKGVAFIDDKRVWNVVRWYSIKNNRMISVYFQGKPFKSMPLTANAKEVDVEWFYEDLQDCLEWTPKKYVLFIIGIGMQK